VKPPRKYRIMSFDGGGIRGVFSARLLERLCSEYTELPAEVDMLAGTSTGAIVAAGIATGTDPAQLTAFYRNESSAVFKDSVLDDIRDMGNLVGAEYSAAPLKRVLKRHFGAATMGEVSKALLIPAFDLDNEDPDPNLRTWKPKFFHNTDSEGADCRELLVDVLMRSCAAPTMLPSYQGFIDGGVTANNPAMTAVAQALATGGAELGSIRLLSFGTGTNLEYIGGKRHDWGLAQWSPFLLRLLGAGSMGVVEFECSRILGECFHRLATILPERIGMDDVKRIDELIALADAIDLAPTREWLARYW
jgi:uncharacterized protein